MNRRIAVTLYLGSWFVALALGVSVLVRVGAPVWPSVALAYVLFLIGNGCLSYREHARKSCEQGAKPVPYFVYLFFGEKGAIREMQISRPIRVLSGCVIACGGVFLLAVSLVFLAQPSNSGHATSVLAIAAVLLLTALLGVSFLYVGARLLLMREGERLLKRISIGTKRNGA